MSRVSGFPAALLLASLLVAAPATRAAAQSIDFNADGKADIIWRTWDGYIAAWTMNGPQMLDSFLLVPYKVPAEWTVVGTGDVDGDGKSDIIWYCGRFVFPYTSRTDDAGLMAVWLMDGTTVRDSLLLGPGRYDGTNYVEAVGDFNRDGLVDFVFRDSLNRARPPQIAFNNGTLDVTTWSRLPTSHAMQAPSHMIGTGDFDRDGLLDIVWYRSRELIIWHMAADGVTVHATATFTFGIPFPWYVEAVGDYDGDGDPDLAWSMYEEETQAGVYAMWLMNGVMLSSSELMIPWRIPYAWRIESIRW